MIKKQSHDTWNSLIEEVKLLTTKVAEWNGGYCIRRVLENDGPRMSINSNLAKTVMENTAFR